MRHKSGFVLCFIALAVLAGRSAYSQSASTTITGTVTLEATGDPLHGATVLVTELRRSVTTDEQGRYSIANVPPGTYEVLAQREHLTTGRRVVTISEGEAATADFALVLSGVHEDITVTANPTGAATTFEAFNAVSSLDAIEIAENIGGTMAEVVEGLPGVSKRSFGPGSSRPVIRGFDGDRVLIMQDGVRTGDLSSQSGDHGVTIDPAGLQRLEVVKGPATLLYGSNAIGGVVNAITPQESFRTTPFEGTVGQLSADGGSANRQAGLSGSVQFGRHNWLVWAGGGGRRTGDYESPIGEIENSATRLANGSAGFGYTGNRGFFSVGAQIEDWRYGIPFAGAFHAHEGEEEETHEGEDAPGLLLDLDGRRQDYRVDAGARNLTGPVGTFRVALNVIDYHHDEIEDEEGVETVGTALDNRLLVFRAEAEQAVRGPLSGRFGLWAQWRDYEAAGEEALAPATTQNTIAGFAYEEMNLGRARLQFGARVEHNGYTPDARPEAEGHEHEGEEHEPPEVRDREFTAFSGSIGVHADIGSSAAFVANLTRSVRAPALEELYNFGPHVGNLAFEIGNPDLERESSVGLDVSLRRRVGPVTGEISGFVYTIDNFVFLSFTGEEVDGLREAEFLQADSRFAGFDAEGSFDLGRRVHLHVGAGYVRARLTDTDEWLPRIPPFHGRIELEIPWRELTFGPELVWTADQDNTFREEQPTAGAALLNVGVTWLRSTGHASHVVAIKAYNLTDEEYRLHTSFIKDLAPEIGRGIRVSYSVRFF
jgi:iron complex outermembrane receptor protein